MKSDDASKPLKANQRNQNTDTASSPNHSHPTSSLRELGANRTVKIVVVGCISVLATIESIFWAKVAWAKFGPEKEKKEEKGEISGNSES